MQPDNEVLTGIVLSVLQFNTLLVTGLLAALGASLNRVWPEGQSFPPLSAAWLAPGLAGALACVYLLAGTYERLAAGVAGNDVLPVVRDWLNSYRIFHYVFAASVIATSFGMVIARRSRR